MSWLPSDPAVRDPVVLLVSTSMLLVATHYLSLGRPVYVQRAIGAVLLGPPPVMIGLGLGFSWTELGVVPGEWARAAAYGAAAGLAIQPVIGLASAGKGFQASRPELVLPEWTWRDVGANVATWAAYLFAYEAFFRGVLLFGLADALGRGVATAAMIAMYALFHIRKDAAETVGTFPIGALFAWIAFDTGTFVGPFVGHLLIGVGGDTWSLWRTGRFPPGDQRRNART